MSATATQRFTEGNRVDLGLIPLLRGADTYTTDYYSMRDYHRATVLVLLGAIAASGTITVTIQQAKDANGSAVKTLTGKVTTELTDVDDNKIVAIEIDASELDVNNKFDHIRASAVTAAGNVTFAVLVIRHQPRYAPVDDSNIDEIVT